MIKCNGNGAVCINYLNLFFYSLILTQLALTRQERLVGIGRETACF